MNERTKTVLFFLAIILGGWGLIFLIGYLILRGITSLMTLVED